MAKQSSLHLRLSEAERAAIEQRAAAAGQGMTAYVVGLALGQLPVTEQLTEINARLERIEAAIARLADR